MLSAPKLSIIACIAEETGIYCVNGGLPGGGFKKDLESFKCLTTGNGRNAVIMGRKTFESLPEESRKGLPDRLNIVITTNPDEFADPESENLMFCGNLHSAVSAASKRCCEEIFFIGGKKVWLEALAKFDITEAYITVASIETDSDCQIQTIEELLPKKLIPTLGMSGKSVSFMVKSLTNEQVCPCVVLWRYDIIASKPLS